MLNNNSESIKKKDDINGLFQFHGICSTCNDASICKNSGNSTHPVWHCEQFNDYTPPVIDSLDKNVIFDGNSQISSKSEEVCSEKYKGLCMNCDNRETCINSETDGGIWHCEDYK